MASCRIGASNVNVSQIDFRKARDCNILPRIATRTWINRRQVQFASLAISSKPRKSYRICCSSPLEADSAKNRLDNDEDTESPSLTSQHIPNSSEVEFLLTELCNSSIAEFELKLGGFRLYVLRDLPETTVPASPPLPPPASASVPVSDGTNKDALDPNQSVSSTSLAITKSVPSQGGIRSFLDSARSLGLAVLKSPMVGFFRRCRTIKGKKAPPACKENQIVKEGQVLCFIEQLGGEVPIESDVAGEVVKILRKDGEPVGYADALIAVRPSSSAIKQLQ